MKKIITCLFALTLLLLGGQPLHASNVKGGDEIIINEPTDGNQYLAAGKIKVRAPVRGDLIAVGGEIWVEDSIRDDAILGAGNIVINGTVGSDLRLMSGSVTVKSDVWGDLIVTGGDIDIEKGVIIHGDLMVAGGEVYCGATVEGQARVAGGTLVFDGIIRQRANLRGGTLMLGGTFDGPVEMVAEKIDLQEGALFKSAVNYWRPDGELDFEGHLEPGLTPRYNTDLKENIKGMDLQNFGMGVIGFTIYRLLAALVLILVLVVAFNRFFTREAGAIRLNWLSRLGYGALLFIGLPILSAVAMITVIGIPAGFLMLSVWGIAALLGHGLTATVLTYELEAYRRVAWNKRTIVLVAGGLFLLLKLIGFIPVVGALINLVLTLVAFGHVLYSIWNRYRSEPEVAEDVV